MSAQTEVGPVQRLRGFVEDRRSRRRLYAVAAVVAALLSVFPRLYVARVKLLPQDSATGASALIAALGGGVQNFAAVLGSQRTNYLVIGRSHDVQQDVIRRLKLRGRKGFHDENQAEKRLSRKVQIEILTGGVLEITARDFDAAFARELATGYTASIQDRLGALGHEQTAHKKNIVVNRLHEAMTRLSEAETAMTQFRRANNLADPEMEFSAAVSRKLVLESQIQAKVLELNTAQEFATTGNMRIKTLMAEIAALRSQLAVASQQGSVVNGMSNKSLVYLRLFQDVKFAQAIVEVYRRFFEEVSVEELSASSNTQVIEQPYIDPRRQFNMSAVGALLLVLALAFYTEYYIPLTGIRSRPSSNA